MEGRKGGVGITLHCLNIPLHFRGGRRGSRRSCERACCSWCCNVDREHGGASAGKRVGDRGLIQGERPALADDQATRVGLRMRRCVGVLFFVLSDRGMRIGAPRQRTLLESAITHDIVGERWRTGG